MPTRRRSNILAECILFFHQTHSSVQRARSTHMSIPLAEPSRKLLVLATRKGISVGNWF